MYLCEVLTRIGGHSINWLDDLLLWNIARPATLKPAKPQPSEDAYCDHM